MKKLIIGILVMCALMAGTAEAGKNPGGKLVAATTTVTGVIVAQVEGVTDNETKQIYVSAVDDAIFVGLWRYTDTGTERVYTSEMYAASGDSIPIPANYILPLDVKVDFITVTAINSSTDVYVNWFRD